MRAARRPASLARVLTCVLTGLLFATLAAPAGAGADTVPLGRLPSEARDTLTQAARGGPFRYDRDGMAFGNYERLLPQQSRGYYREYTVETPGVKHRGARRLVVGCERSSVPPAVRSTGDFAGFSGCAGPASVYYTDDHYRSFRKVLP